MSTEILVKFKFTKPIRYYLDLFLDENCEIYKRYELEYLSLDNEDFKKEELCNISEDKKNNNKSFFSFVFFNKKFCNSFFFFISLETNSIFLMYGNLEIENKEFLLDCFDNFCRIIKPEYVWEYDSEHENLVEINEIFCIKITEHSYDKLDIKKDIDKIIDKYKE